MKRLIVVLAIMLALVGMAGVAGAEGGGIINPNSTVPTVFDLD